MTVDQTPSGTWDVHGAACARGVRFAMEEMSAPKRMLTSTVSVSGGHLSRVSLCSQTAFPKDKIMPVLESLRTLQVEAPIHLGDILVKNAGETGIDLIATSAVERKASCEL